MTTIAIPSTSTDIPTNINTLEKLAAWVGLALARCNPSLKILEDPNLPPQRAAEAVLLKADDNSYRLVIRLSLPIDAGYAENTAKFWTNTNELSNTALPTAYKSN